MEAEGLAYEEAAGRRTGAMPSPLMTLSPTPLVCSWTFPAPHGATVRVHPHSGPASATLGLLGFPFQNS